jgi:hypothetical protein
MKLKFTQVRCECIGTIFIPTFLKTKLFETHHTHEPDIIHVRYKMTQSTGTVGCTSTQNWKWGEKSGWRFRAVPTNTSRAVLPARLGTVQNTAKPGCLDEWIFNASGRVTGTDLGGGGGSKGDYMGSRANSTARQKVASRWHLYHLQGKAVTSGPPPPWIKAKPHWFGINIGYPTPHESSSGWIHEGYLPTVQKYRYIRVCR